MSQLYLDKHTSKHTLLFKCLKDSFFLLLLFLWQKLILLLRRDAYRLSKVTVMTFMLFKSFELSIHQRF